MGKRLLGKMVYYRCTEELYCPAILSEVHDENGRAALIIFDLDPEYPATRMNPVDNGYEPGQWQHPELIPHDEIGNPIPTGDYGESASEAAAEDLQEIASMFIVSFALDLGDGEASKEDVLTAVYNGITGAVIGNRSKSSVHLDQLAARAVKQ